MPRISKTFIAAISCGLIATACGGSGSGGAGSGGSGSGGFAPVTTFPLSTALSNLYSTGFNARLTVSGTASSQNNSSPFTGTFKGTLDVTETPAYAGFTFEADQAAREQTSTLAGSFITDTDGSKGTFLNISKKYLSTNYRLLGVTTSSPTSYCVATTPGQYPETITVGQAPQSVAKYDCYENSSKQIQTGTGTVSFIVGTGTSPTTAILSILEVFVDTSNVQTQFTQKKYLIDTSGLITFISLSYVGLLTSNSSGAVNDIKLDFKSQ